VESGRRVLSNTIASQVEVHARFGGVVPEIASRAHLEACAPLLLQSLEEAGVTMAQVDAIAVTRGPGLAGCLLVGTEFAKGLAIRFGLPIVAVHHIAAHAWSPQLARESDAWGVRVDESASFEPYVALVASGGHSSLIAVKGPLEYETLGETADDAVGEAYDKVAKLLGLGYPGGPLLDRLAQSGNPKAFDLPRPLLRNENLNFSFSGLKSAVARIVEGRVGESGRPLEGSVVADLAASFQAACVDVLLEKCRRALQLTGLRRLAITGGVASNKALREQALERLSPARVALPAPEFCTDNAAMIGGLGYWVLQSDDGHGLELNAAPGLELSASAWKNQ
jgi:N6-L-threonylcarbamoyladenine synthase